ncbi:MAG: RHS repeat-associated core domain-containing protein [Byssovorax sp.]
MNGLYERREQDGNIVHIFRIEGGEGPVAEIRYDESESSLVTEYLPRCAGSLAAVSSDQGKVLRRLHYEPFGKRRDKDGLPLIGSLSEGEIGYTGQRHDDDLGLIDMKGRVYDPSLRRFLSPDPHVSFPLFGQSYNRYSYVLNDPVNLIDPSGLDPENTWTSDYGCGTSMSCPDPIGFEMSFGGPAGDPSGGSSVADKRNGGAVLATPPVEKRPVSLPVGASVPGGTRSGPVAQAWASPERGDFYQQLQIDLAEQIAYNNALWQATEPLRMRRALSTQEQDEEMWKRSGDGGAPPIGYAHDALIYSLNAGHTLGVKQVEDTFTAITVAGATVNAIRAGVGMMRLAAAAGAEANVAAGEAEAMAAAQGGARGAPTLGNLGDNASGTVAGTLNKGRGGYTLGGTTSNRQIRLCGTGWPGSRGSRTRCALWRGSRDLCW